MAKKTKKNPSRAGRDLRELLLVAGDEILEAEGLSGLTLRAVARAVDVSHMAPYRHFEDKDDLLAAIAERGFRGLTDVMEKAWKTGDGPELAMLAVGVAYVNFAIDHPALYRLMFSAGIEDRARFANLTAAGDAAFAACLAGVTANASSGKSLSDEDLRNQAKATWALVHGLAKLTIDGQISLPEGDVSARSRGIEDILMASS